jgi:hypothetical protein
LSDIGERREDYLHITVRLDRIVGFDRTARRQFLFCFVCRTLILKSRTGSVSSNAGCAKAFKVIAVSESKNNNNFFIVSCYKAE